MSVCVEKITLLRHTFAFYSSILNLQRVKYLSETRSRNWRLIPAVNGFGQSPELVLTNVLEVCAFSVINARIYSVI
jgi:hypothetical protein